MRTTLTAYVLMTGAAWAHEGHEAAREHGHAHWLMEPDHIALLILGGLAVFAGVRAVLRRNDDRM